MLFRSDPTATVTINLSPNDPLYDAANGVTSISIRRADVANAGDAGADGTFGTIDDVGLVNPDASLVLNGDETNFAKAQYINNTGLLIDQSQTYGSSDQITNLLREWVSADGGATFHAGMNLFDGTTLTNGWLRPGATVETHDTLPTLSELRDHVLNTGRDALTWEDVADYRNRNADGDVVAGNRKHLRDAVAHQARADNSNLWFGHARCLPL